MREFLPLMIVGAIVGVFSVIFVTAYLLMRRRAESAGFANLTLKSCCSENRRLLWIRLLRNTTAAKVY